MKKTILVASLFCVLSLNAEPGMWSEYFSRIWQNARQAILADMQRRTDRYRFMPKFAEELKKARHS